MKIHSWVHMHFHCTSRYFAWNYVITSLHTSFIYTELKWLHNRKAQAHSPFNDVMNIYRVCALFHELSCTYVYTVTVNYMKIIVVFLYTYIICDQVWQNQSYRRKNFELIFSLSNLTWTQYFSTNFTMYAENPMQFNKTYRLQIAHTEKVYGWVYFAVIRLVLSDRVTFIKLLHIHMDL